MGRELGRKGKSLWRYTMVARTFFDSEVPALPWLSFLVCIGKIVNSQSHLVVCREMRINRFGWVGVGGQYLLLCLSSSLDL